MSDDFYCTEILSGRIQVERVFETDHVLAYHHTNPLWPVHIIVIPKVHVESFLTLLDEDSELVMEVISVLKKVVTLVTKKHGGCRLTTNFGNCQQTKHLHWHVYFGNMMS